MAKVQILSKFWQEIPFTILARILELTSLQRLHCLDFETGNPNNCCVNIQVDVLAPESLHGRLDLKFMLLSNVLQSSGENCSTSLNIDF